MSVNKEDVSNVVDLDTEKKLKRLKAHAKFFYERGMAPLVLYQPGEVIKWGHSKGGVDDGKRVVGNWKVSKIVKSGKWGDYAATLHDKITKKKKLFNLGMVMGKDYVDIDLDCDTAREIASSILPPTGWMFGRESAGKTPTHYVYRVTGNNRPGYKGWDKLLEYRTGAGHQTAFPPSGHKSGYELKWVTPPDKCEPGEIEAVGLFKTFKTFALIIGLLEAECIYSGNFHNSMLYIGGGFYHAGIPIEEAEKYFGIIAEYTGQEGLSKRLAALKETYKLGESGGRVKGFNGLHDDSACGFDEKTIKAIKLILKKTAFEDFPDDESGETSEAGRVDMLPKMEKHIYLCPSETGLQYVDTSRLPHLSVLSASSFKAKYKPYKTLDGKGEWVNALTTWDKIQDKQEVVGEAFLPNGDRIIEKDDGLYINLYYELPHDFDIDTDKMQPFVDHMLYLFPGEKDRDLFLNWMAHIVQYPEKRIQWAPLLVSDPGIGKSYLEVQMKAILGVHNIGSASIGDLVDESKNFNEFLYDTLFCCIHEVKEGEQKGGKKFAMTEKLKHTLIDSFMQVNKKSGFKGGRQVYTNFLLLSNHPGALAVDPKDRRLWVHLIEAGKQDTEYYNRLFEMLEDKETVDQIWSYLMSRDLSKFSHGEAPPMTDAKEEMINLTRNEKRKLVKQHMDGDSLNIELITPDQLWKYAEVNGHKIEEGQLEAYKRSLGIALADEGAVNVFPGDKRFKYKNKMVKVWVLSNAGYWKEKAITDTKLIKEYLERVDRHLEGVYFGYGNRMNTEMEKRKCELIDWTLNRGRVGLRTVEAIIEFSPGGMPELDADKRGEWIPDEAEMGAYVNAAEAF